MAAPNPQLGKTGKYGDLKKRLTFLLLALVVFRIGAHIPVPGIDPIRLAELFQSQQGGVLGLVDMVSGGAPSRAAPVRRGGCVVSLLWWGGPPPPPPRALPPRRPSRCHSWPPR